MTVNRATIALKVHHFLHHATIRTKLTIVQALLLILGAKVVIAQLDFNVYRVQAIHSSLLNHAQRVIIVQKAKISNHVQLALIPTKTT